MGISPLIFFLSRFFRGFRPSRDQQPSYVLYIAYLCVMCQSLFLVSYLEDSSKVAPSKKTIQICIFEAIEKAVDI